MTGPGRHRITVLEDAENRRDPDGSNMTVAFLRHYATRAEARRGLPYLP